MKYRTILFDLDGTLLNTLDDLTDSVNYTFSLHGRPLVTPAKVRLALGYGADYLLKHCLENGDNDPDIKAMLADYVPYYETHAEIKTAPYPGMTELVDSINRAGGRCAIISNKPDGATKRLGKKYFGERFAATQGECPGIRPKPCPDAVLAAMKTLDGTLEDSIYIGDSEVDVRTAKNAGIPVIGVEWGFRDRALLEREGADYIVKTAEEIKNIII